MNLELAIDETNSRRSRATQACTRRPTTAPRAPHGARRTACAVRLRGHGIARRARGPRGPDGSARNARGSRGAAAQSRSVRPRGTPFRARERESAKARGRKGLRTRGRRSAVALPGGAWARERKAHRTPGRTRLQALGRSQGTRSSTIGIGPPWGASGRPDRLGQRPPPSRRPGPETGRRTRRRRGAEATTSCAEPASGACAACAFASSCGAS